MTSYIEVFSGADGMAEGASRTMKMAGNVGVMTRYVARVVTIDFRHSVEIGRPAADVFAFIAEFENNPRWQGGMKACDWTSDQTMVVGATYRQRASFLGRRIDTHFRVTEYQPAGRISIESTQSTFPIQVTRSVEELGPNRCRVTAHIRGQPTGVLKLFGRMVEKSVAKDYLALKHLLEA